MAGFHGVSWVHRSTELGYWLAESAQGRGTMTRAVSTLVDHAFSTWRLNRVAIRAAVDNRRSRAIPERLGFRREGVLRQVERVGGRFVDHVVYAILAEEWSRGRRRRPGAHGAPGRRFRRRRQTMPSHRRTASNHSPASRTPATTSVG